MRNGGYNITGCLDIQRNLLHNKHLFNRTDIDQKGLIEEQVIL